MDPPSTYSAQPGFVPYDDLNFTVHEYHNSTSLPNRTSQTAIVDEAYQLLKGVIPGYSRWITRATEIPVLKTNPGNWFTLAQRPPVLEIGVEGDHILREWGSTLTVDEIFELNDLEDFVGTDLTFLLEGNHKRSIQGLEYHDTNVENLGSSEEQTFKKKKLNLEPLYYMLPQPHMLPSPFLSSDPPLVDAKFLSAEPLFVAPYSSLSLSDDAHVAWLIPVLGVLPWEDSSSAILLDDDSDYLSISIDGYNGQILWTVESLLKFWDFLIELRTSCTVGALGISFHASRNNQRARTTPTNHKPPPFSTPVPTSNSVSSSAGSRPTLLMLDYVKVYHDLRRWLHLRHLLNEWTHLYVAEDGHSRQFKVLKNARLVLLDELSQAIHVL